MGNYENGFPGNSRSLLGLPSAAQLALIYDDMADKRREHLKKLRSVSEAFCKTETLEFERCADLERELAAKEKSMVAYQMMLHRASQTQNAGPSAYYGYSAQNALHAPGLFGWVFGRFGGH